MFESTASLESLIGLIRLHKARYSAALEKETSVPEAKDLESNHVHLLEKMEASLDRLYAWYDDPMIEAIVGALNAVEDPQVDWYA